MRKVTTDKNTVNISNINEEKAYFFKSKCTGWYKLHKIKDGFAWIELFGSICWADGSHNSMKEAIRLALYDNEGVFEIENEFDLIKLIG